MTVATQVRALVRAGAREWWRTRGLALLALTVLLVFGLASFLAGLAVTEVTAQQIVFHAGLVRPLLLLLFALVIVVSVVRELDERVLDTLLARPLARRTWYLSKLATQWLLALPIACAAALPLTPVAPAGALAAWALSLACELAVIAAFALAAAVSLGRVASAMAAVGGFYVLARSSAAFVLLSTGPTVDLANPVNRVVAYGARGVALLLPDLARYTQTAWLVDGADVQLGYVLAQSLLYGVLLTLLGLIDFERRAL